MSASSATSPRAFTVILRDRSPRAIAVAAVEIERTWLVRLLAIVFTESVSARQVPATPRTSAWPPSLPSVPTSRATRVTSSAKLESWSTIVFTVRPIRRNSPRSGRPSISSAMCWDRSPSATASITRAISAVGAARSSISALTACAPGRPRAVVGLLVEPLGHPALAADDPADPQQVPVAPLLQRRQLVELVDDLARRARRDGPAGPRTVPVAPGAARRRARRAGASPAASAHVGRSGGARRRGCARCWSSASSRARTGGRAPGEA